MSLPAAKKDISDHPVKNAVASPTDKTALAKDVDRKLRLYGVIQAFRQGRMPDNAQIDETLCFVRDHSPVETEKLSPEGKKLIDDSRAVIETARLLVKEKNADEIVQQFVYHTSGAEYKAGNVDAPVSQKEARKDGQEALQHLRTLFQLLVTNSETRKLLTDFQLIGRGLFADAATNIADRARPAPEEMERVDDAAPSSQFQSNGNVSGAVSHLNDPTIRTNVAEQPVTSSAPASATTPTSAHPIGEKDAEKAGKVADSTVDKAAEKAADSSLPVDDASADAKKRSLKSRFQGLKGRVPDKHKTAAKNEYANVKDYMSREFPQERVDQFVYRMKKVVVECQSHPSYQASLSWFLDQLEVYFGHGKNIASSGANSTNTFFSDPLLQQATSELRVFLERCANNKSLDGIINAAQKLREDAQNDEDLRAWWKRVDTFVRKSLLEPGYILAPVFDTQAKELRNQSRVFFDEKYKGHKDAMVDAIQSWFGAWGEDPLNKRFADDWTQLVKDLLFDQNGNLTYKPHLWTDIRQVILPTLIEKVGYVPIPRIEYTDDNFDLVIENLTLQGRNIFPNILEFNAQNYVKISPYNTIRDEHHHTVTVTLSQIQADMRDVAFYYNKKAGLPRIKDSGLADVFLGGKGITVKIKISSTTQDRQNGTSLYKVKDVDVKVGTLKFAIRDSKHDLLYKTLRPLATGLIKKQIAKAISDGIRTALEYADVQLVEVRNRMTEASTSEDGSRREVLKQMFTRTSSKDDSSSKDGSVKSKRHSHFKIVPMRDSMLLPDAGHEKGWIRKQGERDDIAAEGEGWRSKAFSIVPATA